MAEGDTLSPVQPNLTKLRDDECIPVAKKILKILAEKEDLVIGSNETVDKEKALAYYSNLYEKEVAPLLVEHNLKVDHAQFVFRIAMQALQLLEERVSLTVSTRYDQAVAKKFGVDDVSELRISNIQDTLVEKQSTVQK